MLIRHKVAKGETFDKILKKYGVKDGKGLWALPANKQIRAKYKSPNDVSKGDDIWVPDPKSKIYEFKYKGKTQFYSEREWEEFQAMFMKNMKDRVLKEAKIRKLNLDIRHRDLKNIKKEFGFTTWLYETVAWNELSDAEKAKADKAIKALEAAISSGKVALVQPAVKATENALAAYAAEVNEYTEDLIGTGDTLIFATELTRDGSFAIAGVIAGTMAAPAVATVGAMAKAGFVVGSSVAFTKSVAGEVGQALAGKANSPKKIAWNVLRDTLTGGVSDAITGPLGSKITGALAPRLAGFFKGRPFARKLATAVVKSDINMVNKLTGGALKELVAKHGSKKAQEILIDSVAEILVDIPTGKAIGLVQDWLSGETKALSAAASKAMKKTNGQETVEDFASKIEREMKTDALYNDVAKGWIAKQGKQLQTAMEKRASQLESA
ncbi:MAG: hypothetical protein AAFR79_10740 [Pseudomonadota bacterium]